MHRFVKGVIVFTFTLIVLQLTLYVWVSVAAFNGLRDFCGNDTVAKCIGRAVSQFNQNFSEGFNDDTK